MPATLTDMFRTLTSFAPVRVDLRGGPWEEYVARAIGQGLAPLSAYNLEYRLGGAGAPDWARAARWTAGTKTRAAARANASGRWAWRMAVGTKKPPG